MWDVSASRESYPTYIKDSLLNTNPTFDYGPFRKLREQMASNLTVRVFAYVFTEAGTYVFADNADSTQLTIITVVAANATCPSTARFLPTTTSNMVSVGIATTASIQLAPDWLVIGLV